MKIYVILYRVYDYIEMWAFQARGEAWQEASSMMLEQAEESWCPGDFRHLEDLSAQRDYVGMQVYFNGVERDYSDHSILVREVLCGLSEA